VLKLPTDAASAIVTDVRDHGSSRVETGGFVLSSLAEPEEVSVVAVAGRAGIARRRGLFGISGGALDQLFAWADAHALRIPAQFHSHAGRAFLSPTDLAHGLSVRGFVTCIVPFFADPPLDPGAWGWWRFDGAKWVSEPAPAAIQRDVPVGVVSFDEDGVR